MIPGMLLMDSRGEECDFCHSTFADSRKLYRHLFNDHNLSKDKIGEIKEERRYKQVAKKVQSGGKSRTVFECEICNKPYLSKLGLDIHKERQHNQVRLNVPSANNVICPIQSCGSRFSTYFDLATHADVDHRDLVSDHDVFFIHRAVFENFNEFRVWRQLKEDSTMSRFYTRSSEIKIKYAKKVWLLKCAHTNRKRPNLFSTDHCPAFIRICERYNGSVEAVACFGHLGHVHPTRVRPNPPTSSRRIDYSLEAPYESDEKCPDFETEPDLRIGEFDVLDCDDPHSLHYEPLEC